jgi:hypothetical protein
LVLARGLPHPKSSFSFLKAVSTAAISMAGKVWNSALVLEVANSEDDYQGDGTGDPDGFILTSVF